MHPQLRWNSNWAPSRHQRLKHAAASLFGTCWWGLLKHSAACRNTLKIGWDFFLGKILDQNINPIPSTHLPEMARTLVVKCCICDWDSLLQFLEATVSGKTARVRGP